MIKYYMNSNFQMWLTRIDRIAAWILLAAIILFFISGYGLTKGVIGRQLARDLHLNILPLIALASFVIHTGLAVRLSLIRWRIWNKVSLTLLVLACLAFSAIFGYIELLYNVRV